MAKYYQQVYAVDVASGMIRDELKKRGVHDMSVSLHELSVVFFTS